MKTLMRNGRDRRSENPLLGHAKKERVLLFGTDQRITSGPAAKRPPSKAEYMTAPERFADSQIPLAPRAPSIHGPPLHLPRCGNIPGIGGIADTPSHLLGCRGSARRRAATTFPTWAGSRARRAEGLRRRGANVTRCSDLRLEPTRDRVHSPCSNVRPQVRPQLQTNRMRTNARKRDKNR